MMFGRPKWLTDIMRSPQPRHRTKYAVLASMYVPVTMSITPASVDSVVIQMYNQSIMGVQHVRRTVRTRILVTPTSRQVHRCAGSPSFGRVPLLHEVATGLLM